jgi:hypothetical protein
MLAWLLPIAGGLGLIAYSMHEHVEEKKEEPKPAGQAQEEHLPQPTLADTLSQSGKAVQQAKALYSYLRAHGNDHSPALQVLIMAFQRVSNNDANAVALSGPLQLTGVYDALTSSALTLYTQDPIPAPVTGPSVPVATGAAISDISKPGGAAISGYNLYMFIKKHGVGDKGAAFRTLVMQFQHDVNTDTKFPGPAVGLGMPRIAGKLKEDGLYGPATAGALKILTGG